MSLLTATELAIAFGGKVILDGASFAVQPGERLGLVGPNGSGKSTILRILAGEREADDGEVGFARGVRVGYLPQDILGLPAGTLVESVRSAVPGRDALAASVAAIEEDLGEAADEEAVLELSQRLADGHHDLVVFEERYGRHRAESILGGLGFSASELDRDVGELSGGWRMRAALAGLLLLDPDVLLLDEPTNHLDVPSLHWFDHFLRRSKHAVVLVSHDRDFLNRQIRRVLSFEPEGLRSYTGNYDAYRVQRAEEEVNLELRAKRQAAQRAETERFIERFRYKSSKARQVQSRVKQLEKVERVVVREARSTVRFRFPEVARSGREALRIDGLDKRFGDKVLFRGLTRAVERGERIAIIGPNGAGKTTLLKMIAGELAPDAGRIEVGHNVRVAYYAQHHTEILDGSRTVLEQIWSLVPGEAQAHVRSVLGAFLFQGDDVEKPIRVLSGGERARVALARLLVVPSNLMLMDEPTNHLDLDSSERLVEALAAYDGTLVFVSHNRSFINQLATRVWDVGGGDVSEWKGNLDDYLYHLEQIGRPLGGISSGDARPEPAAEAPAENDRERRRREARERDARAAKLRPLRTEVATLEAAIASLEAERKALEVELADHATDFQRMRPRAERFAALGVELEDLYVRWAAAGEALAALET